MYTSSRFRLITWCHQTQEITCLYTSLWRLRTWRNTSQQVRTKQCKLTSQRTYSSSYLEFVIYHTLYFFTEMMAHIQCTNTCSTINRLLSFTAPTYLWPIDVYYTLSGRIGKVVASLAEGCEVARSNPNPGAELHRFILRTRRSGGTAQKGVGCGQSIGSIVSDAIVNSWLWSTATSSSPLGYFSRLLQVVDNWPHILW